METRTKYVLLLTGTLVALFILALGVADIVLITNSQDVTNPETECPRDLDELTTLALTRKDRTYHWSYKIEGFADAAVEQICPSATHDSKIIIGGHLISQTDGKILTTVGKTYIRDCHGIVQRILQTDSATGTRLEIRDTANKILAYIEPDKLSGRLIEIKGLEGESVALLNNPDDDNWDIIITNTSSPAADMKLLVLLAAKNAFNQDDDNADQCNIFFMTVAYIYLALVSIGFCSLIYWIRKRCCVVDRIESSNDNEIIIPKDEAYSVKITNEMAAI